MQRLICACSAIADSGKGVRFNFKRKGGSVTAFALRYRGRVYDYINRYAHMGLELDRVESEFFDVLGLYLICSAHGAMYAPNTGLCVAGPCKGAGLERLAVEEKDSKVYLLTKED